MSNQIEDCFQIILKVCKNDPMQNHFSNFKLSLIDQFFKAG